MEGLRYIYENCGGNLWLQKWGWSTGDRNLLKWTGIRMHANTDRVGEINLSKNKLVGPLPALGLNAFTGLQTLQV